MGNIPQIFLQEKDLARNALGNEEKSLRGRVSMKVLVVFGSKSDAYVYEPLKASLIDSGFEVDFRFLSVHRSPELLDRELEGLSADIVVAGAGLSAHLPGVLASKILLPVIGIPCAPAFGGLDALLSIQQMPFGIPVLATAPDEIQSTVEFIREASQMDLSYAAEPVQIIVEKNKMSLPYIDSLLSRAKALAEKAGVGLSVRSQPEPGAVEVVLVEVDSQAADAPIPFPRIKGGLRVHVPVFKESAYRDAGSAQSLLKKMKANGGIWVGANNIGNGFLAGLQLANAAGNYSAVLTNAKKGYMHLYG
jgi:5-(carboxyamino)imidazole ribonucleotide mutase